MRLEEVYNYENFEELKNELELEFFSSLVWIKHSFAKDERIQEFKYLEKKLDWFYAENKCNLVDKLRNKKYIENLFLEISLEEIKITHKVLINEIPEF